MAPGTRPFGPSADHASLSNEGRHGARKLGGPPPPAPHLLDAPRRADDIPSERQMESAMQQCGAGVHAVNGVHERTV